MNKIRLIFIPLAVTLAVLLVRFVMEAAETGGRSYLNITYLIPVFAVYLSYVSVVKDMGFGGFQVTFILYTLAVRLSVILLSLAGEASGLGGSYFAAGNIFFLIVPQLLFWPAAAFIVGTFLWPAVAMFTAGHQVAYRGVAICGGVILVITFIGIPYGISSLYTGGLGRRSFQDTPEIYDVAFEDITLTAADGMNLQGWYIPNSEADGTVIFCHGLFNQRSEMLEQAIFMNGQGYRALLFDFRNHGKSDGSYTSFGYHERQDVVAALDYVKQTRAETGPIILWGISMGGANSLLTAAEQPDVSAVIAESSFYSVSETLRHDLTRMFRLPVTPFAWLVEFVTEMRLGISIQDLNVGEAAARIQDCPVLLIGGTADERMPIRNNERLFKVIPGEMKDQWVVEGAGHADIWKTAKDEYKARVVSFLNRYIRKPDPME